LQRLLDFNRVDLELPPQHFVFAGHQGYLFHFFDSAEPIDPPVYSYYESNSEFDQIFPSFSGYLLSGLELSD
jgi:hypothetical protein